VAPNRQKKTVDSAVVKISRAESARPSPKKQLPQPSCLFLLIERLRPTLGV
jgi:hypothetical protein